MRLAEHASEIIRARVTAGCYVAIDNLTDNLFVHNGTEGFAVTHLCLDTWERDRILCDVQEASKAIVNGQQSDKAHFEPLPDRLRSHMRNG
jgi:hypothetical protein